MKDRLALCLLLAVCGESCGSTQAEQHHALNAITQVADPTYETAVQGCDEARNAIVARQGTTYEQDLRAMERINRVCDSIVLSFEALRSTQLTAREFIHSGAEAAATRAVTEGLTAWARLQALVPQLATLGQEEE